MKPLVEQMIIFLHPFSRLNSIYCMKITVIKKKIYYVYYQGFTVILLG